MYRLLREFLNPVWLTPQCSTQALYAKYGRTAHLRQHGARLPHTACRTPPPAASRNVSLWPRTREPRIRMTIPGNDADDADRARKALGVLRSWTETQPTPIECPINLPWFRRALSIAHRCAPKTPRQPGRSHPSSCCRPPPTPNVPRIAAARAQPRSAPRVTPRCRNNAIPLQRTGVCPARKSLRQTCGTPVEMPFPVAPRRHCRPLNTDRTSQCAPSARRRADGCDSRGG